MDKPSNKSPSGGLVNRSKRKLERSASRHGSQKKPVLRRRRPSKLPGSYEEWVSAGRPKQSKVTPKKSVKTKVRKT